MELTHEHFIIDAHIKHKLSFKAREKITNELIDELIDALDMVKLGPLKIYDAVDSNYPGWSFIQPITTSHISGHYFEESNLASHIHLDIYSCMHYDWKLVVEILHKHLMLNSWSGNLIIREIEQHKRKMFNLEGLGNKVDIIESTSIPK